MRSAPSKPDLTFVTLIHQSLRAGAARLAAAIAKLGCLAWQRFASH